jgi:tetratricopeptide (TPR) repeat protein
VTKPEELFRAALAAARLVDERLGERGPAAVPGDIRAFEVPDPACLLWTVLLMWPTAEDLLYIVPTDMGQLAAGTDYVVPDTDPLGGLVLRCELGFWLRREALTRSVRVGALEDSQLREAAALAQSCAPDPDEDLVLADIVDDDEARVLLGSIIASRDALRKWLVQPSQAPDRKLSRVLDQIERCCRDDQVSLQLLEEVEPLDGGRGPLAARVRFLHGNVLYRLTQVDEDDELALEAFESAELLAVQLHDRHTRCLAALRQGELHLFHDRMSEVEGHLNRAAALANDLADEYLIGRGLVVRARWEHRRAQLAAALAAYHDALPHLRNAHRADPGRDTHDWLLDALVVTGARTTVLRMLEGEPAPRLQAVSRAGSLAMELGRVDDALAYFDACADVTSIKTEEALLIRHDRAVALLNSGRAEEAEAAFAWLLEDKATPDYLRKLSIANFIGVRMAQELPIPVEQARALDSIEDPSPSIVIIKATRLLGEERADEALRVLDVCSGDIRVATDTQVVARWHAVRAGILVTLDREDEALADLNEVLALEPVLPAMLLAVTLYRLGQVFIGREDAAAARHLARAREVLDELGVRPSFYFMALALQTTVEWDLGNREGAKALAEEWDSLQPEIDKRTELSKACAEIRQLYEDALAEEGEVGRLSLLAKRVIAGFTDLVAPGLAQGLCPTPA